MIHIGSACNTGVMKVTARMPLMAMTALQPHILQQGLATAEELESMLAHVEQRTLEPATVQLTFVTVQVWGRKPVTAARSFNTAG